jgi:hypothetical protein
MGGFNSSGVVGLVGSAVVVIACGVESPPRGFGPAAALAPDDPRGTELAFPGEPGELGEGLFFIGSELQPIEYEMKAGLAIHEGDIVLGRLEDMSPLQLGEEGVSEAAVKPDALWEKGIVPYVFDDGLGEAGRDAFLAAVAHWQEKTALRFVERKDQADYLRIIADSGCWSWAGRVGGEQQLSLGAGCESMGIAAHEIGHAIGFWHEQSRSDRDKNVVVVWDNIQDGQAFNFQTYAEQGVIGEDVGGYNTESLMHYASTAFAKAAEKPTITKLDGSSIDGNRSGLTSTDIEGAVRLYGPRDEGEEDKDDCGMLWPDQRLGHGEARQSCDGRFVLIMQHDGNLVLYQGAEPLWHAGTHDSGATSAVMQSDGNLVVYDDAGTAMWASGTNGYDWSAALVQDDGNLVIYSSDGKALWGSDTCCR